MTEKTMVCAECGQQKNWADGFPSHTYAVCWQCHWDAHCEEEHPLPRSQRRKIRRAARTATTAKLLADARTEWAAYQLASDSLPRSAPPVPGGVR